jgi:hypothetical protein
VRIPRGSDYASLVEVDGSGGCEDEGLCIISSKELVEGRDRPGRGGSKGGEGDGDVVDGRARRSVVGFMGRHGVAGVEIALACHELLAVRVVRRRVGPAQSLGHDDVIVDGRRTKVLDGHVSRRTHSPLAPSPMDRGAIRPHRLFKANSRAWVGTLSSFGKELSNRVVPRGRHGLADQVVILMEEWCTTCMRGRRACDPLRREGSRQSRDGEEAGREVGVGVLELLASEEALQRLGLLREEGGMFGVRSLQGPVVDQSEDTMSRFRWPRLAEVLVQGEEHAQARCSQANLVVTESVDRDEGQDIGRLSGLGGGAQNGADDQPIKGKARRVDGRM